MNNSINNSKEPNSYFLRSAGIVAFFTILSRISGLLRDIAFAFVLGAGWVADAFVVAFRIPNMVRRFVGEGSLTVSFIPVYKSILTKEDEEERKNFLIHSLNSLYLILIPVIIAGIVFAPYIIKIFAPGFSKETLTLASELMRITFPYLFFMGFLAYFMGYLNAHNHFVSPSAAPVILNVVLILSSIIAYVFDRERAVFWIAWGVLIAGLLQFLIQIPPALKNKFTFRFYFGKENLKDKNVREVGKLLIPSVISVSAYQINIFITNILASFLPAGSIAYLYYASRFLELPLGVFVFSISTASLPVISGLKAQSLEREYRENVNETFSSTLLFLIPASVGLLTLALPITRVFFQRGNFTAQDAILTSSAIKMYAIGLLGVGLTRMAVQVFYSSKDAVTPLKSAYLSLVVNAILSLILMKPLKHNGLALATSVSSYFQFFYLNFKSRSAIVGKGGFISYSVFRSFIKYTFASVLMWMLLEFTFSLDRWRGNGIMGVAYLLFQVLLCSIFYFSILYLLKDETFKKVLLSFKRK